jgi:hypothetical protein
MAGKATTSHAAAPPLSLGALAPVSTFGRQATFFKTLIRSH